ncbi:MAG: hypothetical protein GY703_25645 [Gammaproteobacteria bacterium]|nr:hypothetical protein [Gammaproteobacteria bacterium]
MNEKLESALNHLQSILPLKERQEDCSKSVKALHQQILRSFVDRGRILSRDEMAKLVDDLEKTISTLQEKDMVVFSDQGEPVGAYPFTTEQREHSISVNGHRVYAMCALDALAVSPMFKKNTRITSRCRVTGSPVNIEQSGNRILNPDEAADVHFGIIWGAESSETSCADSLCMEMIFLRDTETARYWVMADPENREIFNLQEAIEFGGRFFVPLLDS